MLTGSKFKLNLNHTSEEEIKINLKRLELLYRLGIRIFEEHDPNSVFRSILDAVKSLLTLERAFVATFEDQKIIPRVLENIELSENHSQWPVSKTMIESVKNGNTILSFDATNEEEYKNIESIRNLDIRSVVCCPIGAPEKPEGFIYADNRISKGVFSENDAFFLNALSHYAYLSLTNSEIYWENRISKLREKDIQKNTRNEMK
jgi:transcriptional regulator with GAF, ATPase, and Fis domain